MRIAQLARDYSPNGGVGRYVAALGRALANAGHEVLVVHADRAARSAEGLGRQVYAEGFDEFVALESAEARGREVLDALSRFGPDVVHVQGCNNFWLEAELRRRYPAIKTLHVYDFCPSGTKYHHAWRRVCRHPTGAWCLARMVYKRCELSRRPAVLWRQYVRTVEANRHHAGYPRLIVASEYVKRQAVATGYSEARLLVVPYFTTLPATVVSPPADSRMVLFVGRVMRYKGLTDLIAALARVRAPWRLMVAGDGADRPRAERLAARLGLARRVEFLGWVTGERLRACYEQAAVVAMPSLWPEPFGLVGLEAMSYGRPVVAFRVGGIPEWLQDGITGWLVPPADRAALAEAIAWLLDRPALAREMGMAGRLAVEARFSEAAHLARLVEAYRRLGPLDAPCAPEAAAVT